MTDEILTISVPEAGRRYFGLSRNGSYAAAARGEIPTIGIGRLKRVPVRALEALLNRVSESALAESQSAIPEIKKMPQTMMPGQREI
jgi:hypothetical protein